MFSVIIRVESTTHSIKDLLLDVVLVYVYSRHWLKVILIQCRIIRQAPIVTNSDTIRVSRRTRGKDY